MRSVVLLPLLAACGAGSPDTEDPDPYRGPECERGLRNLGNGCEQVPELWVGIHSTFLDDFTRTERRLQAVSYVPIEGVLPEDVGFVELDREGSCFLSSQYVTSGVTGCADWGRVTVGIDGASHPLDYRCIDDEANAVVGDDAGTFVPGGPAEVSGVGGAVFPAFTTTIDTFDRLDAEWSPLTLGEDMAVTWTPGPGRVLAWLDVRNAQDVMSLRCDVPGDRGEVVLPGRLTAQLPDGAGFYAQLIVSRWASERIEPETADVSIEVYSASSIRSTL